MNTTKSKTVMFDTDYTCENVLQRTRTKVTISRDFVRRTYTPTYSSIKRLNQAMLDAKHTSVHIGQYSEYTYIVASF